MRKSNGICTLQRASKCKNLEVRIICKNEEQNVRVTWIKMNKRKWERNQTGSCRDLEIIAEGWFHSMLSLEGLETKDDAICFVFQDLFSPLF